MVGPRPQTLGVSKFSRRMLQPIISSVRLDCLDLVQLFFEMKKTSYLKMISLLIFMMIIAPYKGDVEAYYIKVVGIFSYFKIIFLTLWVVIFPKSGAVWKVFVNIPAPPDSLKKFLNYN